MFTLIVAAVSLVSPIVHGQGYPVPYESREPIPFNGSFRAPPAPVPYGGCNGGGYAYSAPAYYPGASAAPAYANGGAAPGAYPGAYAAAPAYSAPAYAPQAYAPQAYYAPAYPYARGEAYAPAPEATAGPRIDFRYEQRSGFLRRRPSIQLRVRSGGYPGPCPGGVCYP